MKRIFVTLLLLGAAALGASAQSWQDAFYLSENHESGTARSVAMGNAMTAVGGDLGSLTFNPAGSAVSGYSQFTLTSGFSLSSTFAQGTAIDGEPFGFEDPSKDHFLRMKLPNFGFMGVFDMHRSSGLKRITFGLVGNATNDYTNRYLATGTNGNTSISGALASGAMGYSTSELDGSFFSGDTPWDVMTAYQGYMISPISGRPGEYLGVSEVMFPQGDIALPGFINQRFSEERRGYKYDYLLNIGFDISDILYLGANLGMSTLSHHMSYGMQESPVANNADRFVQQDGSLFQTSRFRYTLDTEGSGAYLKGGFLLRPVAGLRIGAAIQTPTVFTIHEVEAYDVRTEFSSGTRSARSADGEYHYKMRTPYRVDAGLAYTFGQVALLSVDYTLTDYRTMEFRDMDGYTTDFESRNWDIRDNVGLSHTIRVGGELRPVPALAIRAGYNYVTSPEIHVPEATHTKVSFGLGYSSSGSFFADLAVRFHWLPFEYNTVYFYGTTDSNGQEILTPQIGVSPVLTDALLTLGWRF